MPRYIHFMGETPYAGTSYDEYVKFDDDTPDSEIDCYSDDLCHENAESFEYLETGWDDDWESEEDRENYYESCYGSWEEISKEEYEANKI